MSNINNCVWQRSDMTGALDRGSAQATSSMEGFTRGVPARAPRGAPRPCSINSNTIISPAALWLSQAWERWAWAGLDVDGARCCCSNTVPGTLVVVPPPATPSPHTLPHTCLPLHRYTECATAGADGVGRTVVYPGQYRVGVGPWYTGHLPPGVHQPRFCPPRRYLLL